MIEDQRFAAARPDVLVYETEPLTEDVTIAGPIIASLQASTSGTDADWVVKLIDVLPGDTPNNDPNPAGVRMGHFQMLLAGEVMRAKYRKSYEKPEPMVPGQATGVEFDLRDRYHTFKKGHRIMVQVQSSWFPRDRSQSRDVHEHLLREAVRVSANHPAGAPVALAAIAHKRAGRRATGESRSVKRRTLIPTTAPIRRQLVNRRTLLIGAVWLGGAAGLPAQGTRLLRHPTVSRELVAFQYAGDLWSVPRTGGQARRLTATPGVETDPRFSPDGSQIAFIDDCRRQHGRVRHADRQAAIRRA